MSILKKDYESIPNSIFESKNVDVIFDHYCSEFLKEDNTESEFVEMALNIIRDFLEHKFDENMLSFLIHKSLLDKRTRKYHQEPHLWSINDVLALWLELLDITWIKDGSEYKKYLEELQDKFTYLVRKYQNSASG